MLAIWYIALDFGNMCFQEYWMCVVGGNFYVLLNLAVGGTNGGNPWGTSFPAKFEVDYVRVYQ